MAPSKFSMLLFVAILIAEEGPQPPALQTPAMTRDEIRAVRKNFEREMETDKRRPWDGMALTGPHALEKLPAPDKK